MSHTKSGHDRAAAAEVGTIEEQQQKWAQSGSEYNSSSPYNIAAACTTQ